MDLSQRTPEDVRTEITELVPQFPKTDQAQLKCILFEIYFVVDQDKFLPL